MWKAIANRVSWFLIQYFSILQWFITLLVVGINNLIFQTNTLRKAVENVSKSTIVLREVTNYTGKKTWKPRRPRKIYQNREIPGDTGRLGRSKTFSLNRLKEISPQKFFLLVLYDLLSYTKVRYNFFCFQKYEF